MYRVYRYPYEIPSVPFHSPMVSHRIPINLPLIFPFFSHYITIISSQYIPYPNYLPIISSQESWFCTCIWWKKSDCKCTTACKRLTYIYISILVVHSWKFPDVPVVWLPSWDGWRNFPCSHVTWLWLCKKCIFPVVKIMLLGFDFFGFYQQKYEHCSP